MSSNLQIQSQTSSNSLKRTDIGWKHCHPTKDNDTNEIMCNYCKKIMKGGITRAKQHLMGKKGNVAPCQSVPEEVKDELWALEKNKKMKESESCQRIMEDVTFGSEDYALEGDLRELEVETHGINERKKVATKKGPIDLFCKRPKTAIAKNKEKLKQINIRDSCDKEATARVHQYIARFWYQAGLSFNMIKLESFHDMVAAIGSFGPHLRPPSYHDIRVPLLQKEMEHTEKLMKSQKEHWASFGCSIMSDAWTDKKQRCIINFLVNSSVGTMFIKSVDGSNFVKTGEKLFELLDSIVEDIGEEKVVQVITDNGSNYVLAGKMLEAKRKKIFWTPCAAHCIDLMLEDIGKLPNIKKTIQRAISLVGFIYSHSSTLSLLRFYTNKRELVRHAVTRFATSFLSLERIHQEKSNLRKMFVSDEWNSNKLSKEAKGREACKTVLMPSFWRNVVYILKVMAPLVKVLRLVDGEKKPAMGYIYEAMDKAKEAIMKSFNNNETKYKAVFEIVDRRCDVQLHRPLHAAGHFLNPEMYYDNPQMEFDSEIIRGFYTSMNKLVGDLQVEQKIMMELHTYKVAGELFGTELAIAMRKKVSPAQWWRLYGSSTPNLQQLAIKILSLTCSSSGCERNWSVFEQIHTKRRNRLDHKKLHDLVYVKYNQALMRRYNLKDEVDPISLNDIDECNEWLVGEMDGDDDDEVEALDERVFGGNDPLTWNQVYDVSGVGEPLMYTRRNKRKQPPSGEGASSKKGKGVSSSTRKGKGKVVEVVEEDSEEISEELEEELPNINFDKSEDEEVEGYAPLAFNEENDYIEEEEEDD
ncbi:uncharacterized protein LOC109789148 [Cajanus cajan]|uniref:uncharacterized protein LOC109789148 n=2 Tax=Cajanus cajan TaxID=3821 RepID=UPI00098D8749|nr:uncharacterized protein LOC109789148 [Cajanus cajan]